MASLSNSSGVDTTVYESYDGGDPTNSAQGGPRRNSWHRAISPEMWLWLIVVGAIGGLWAIAGGFRKVLS